MKCASCTVLNVYVSRDQGAQWYSLHLFPPEDGNLVAGIEVTTSKTNLWVLNYTFISNILGISNDKYLLIMLILLQCLENTWNYPDRGIQCVPFLHLTKALLSPWRTAKCPDNRLNALANHRDT